MLVFRLRYLKVKNKLLIESVCLFVCKDHFFQDRVGIKLSLILSHRVAKNFEKKKNFVAFCMKLAALSEL